MSLFTYPTYKQQGALASGLLNTGFPSTDNYEFCTELAAPAVNGITVAPSITKSTSGAVDGAISATYAEGASRLVAKVDLKEDLNINWTPPTNVIAGAFVKPNFDVSMKIREYDAVKIKPSLELRHEKFSLTGAVNLQPFKAIFFMSPAFTFLTGIPSKGVSVGADVQFQNTQFSGLNTLISFNSSPMEATVYTKTAISKDSIKTHTLGGTYYQTLQSHPDCAVGAEAVFPLDNPTRPTIIVGATRILNSLASIKARMTTRGLLGFSYTQHMSPTPAKVVISSELNINELNASNSFRYGIKLIFG